MNAVAYYSETNQSRTLAEFLSHTLEYRLLTIEQAVGTEWESLVLVFPVHAQNIPSDVKRALDELAAKSLTLVATYGKMAYGNVLWEIQHGYGFNIVGGAYIPTMHSYLRGDIPFERYDELSPLIEKIKNPTPFSFPKCPKNPFADILPQTRARIGVRIKRSGSCTECGICTELCKRGGIVNGKTTNKCIRCAKCVSICPEGALKLELSLPMKLYLKKKKRADVVIYV